MDTAAEQDLIVGCCRRTPARCLQRSGSGAGTPIFGSAGPPSPRSCERRKPPTPHCSPPSLRPTLPTRNSSSGRRCACRTSRRLDYRTFDDGLVCFPEQPAGAWVPEDQVERKQEGRQRCGNPGQRKGEAQILGLEIGEDVKLV